MCILITKPAGAQFPAIEAIKNSVINNPDGFAMAWNQAGRIHTFKTMDARQFIEAYRDISGSLDPEITGMIIHARIATHGSKNIDNCHCWKSFPDVSLEMAFAHNGILTIPNRGDMTDSETFLRDYFEPAFIRGGWRNAVHIINRHIGSSKFAFIDIYGNIRKFGQFASEEDGCSFSNLSYLSRSYARYADPRMWNTRKSLAI